MDKKKMMKELEGDEGKRRSAYKDHLGYLTIGIGRLIDARKGGGLSDAEIYLLLENDIDEKSKEMDKRLPWWRDQPETVQRALLNMAFQMGVDGLLKFKNSLDLIKKGDYVQAQANLKQSLWYTQTPNRAKRVIAMMRKTGK